MKWDYVRLGDVCSKIGSGATPKGGATVYINKGTSLIRSQNVYNLFFYMMGLPTSRKMQQKHWRE